MSDIITKNESAMNGILWTGEEEELLKDWSDIANSFRWMHERSSIKFKKLNNRIALPVIIISTLTGTANFGISSLIPSNSLQMAQIAIGGANILCGILTTIQTYFKYAENTETHQNSAMLWAKFQRNIAIELALEPNQRKNPTKFLKYCIDEYNKLKEFSPVIPPEIAEQFGNKFKKLKIILPDIYDNLGRATTYSDYLARNANYQNNENISISTKNKNKTSSRDSESDIKIDISNLSKLNDNPNLVKSINKILKPSDKSAFKPNVTRISNIKKNIGTQNIHDGNDISFLNKLDTSNFDESTLDNSEISTPESLKFSTLPIQANNNEREKIQRELESIKPDIKSIINNLQNNLNVTLNNKIDSIQNNLDIHKDSTEIDKNIENPFISLKNI